jgi:hypothetical protein
MRRILLGSVCLATCFCLAATAEANYAYQLTDATGVERNSFPIDEIGQTIDVNVWLRETDTESPFVDGLYSAGVKLSFGSPEGDVLLSVSDILSNPAFDDPWGLLVDVGDNYCTLTMSVADIFSPVYPEPSVDRVWLGTFTFTALRPGVAQLTAADNPEMDDTLTGLGDPLDSAIDPAEASIGMAPEPGGLAILAGLAMCVGPYLWRQRRRAA